MSGTTGRSLRGIVTVTLSLLIVAVPATAALADGGPDRVLPRGQLVSTFEVRCGAEAYRIERPGFGDRIHEGCPQQAPALTSSTAPQGGDNLAPIAGMVAGLALVTGVVALAATTRIRRLRVASGG